MYGKYVVVVYIAQLEGRPCSVMKMMAQAKTLEHKKMKFCQRFWLKQRYEHEKTILCQRFLGSKTGISIRKRI